MAEADTMPSSLDNVLNIVANTYRRRLLVGLLEHNSLNVENPQVLADVQSEDEDLKSLKIQMTHTHLPKLEAAEFIVWNREDNAVQRGPRFGEIRSLLETLQNHADELPDNWL
ncbi:ArsR family transcriptional regulator [Halomicrococcus sp. NG-SE-24]|uniref:ArsR family transcriptional regulator n=1 Tax=Halomicrococcus sp. NG-SE-24 TaxID=3436928 RepID=UPI003D96D50C